jgi:hypothetical protein
MMKATKLNWSVTLKSLRKAEACVSGYNKIVCALSGKEFDSMRDTYIRFRYDKPISLLSILNSNGLDDALWAARCVEGAERDLRKFAVWCVRQVQHLLDERSINVIDTAERYADGEVTAAGLAAARSAAVAAATNGVAKPGSQYAAWAAARAAAWDAAWDAARDAAMAAAWAAAMAATRAAALAAARGGKAAAAMAAQREMFVRMLNGTAPWQKGSE